MSALKTCPQCGSEYELDVMFCPRDGSTLRAPSGGSLVGTIIADRYHILRKLGEGGMGQVYLAEHIKMGRKSAIKVMNPGMSQDPDAIGRFNREASNASRISHPNVAAIYDFGETADGLIYLAMEYIEGEPLTKVMEREHALSPARSSDITRQVASALDAAHDMGIVHRDLKPDNIMLARSRDGSDLVKVVDFGIAKATAGEGQKVTKTGLVVGTPEYMSPEQLAGDTLDGRSDNYTLGLVAFNMLTGTLPFPGATMQESMIMRLTDRPRTLAEMRPDVRWPAAAQQVMDRELQRKADDRYARATEFADALRGALAGMPQPAGAAQPAAGSAGATISAAAAAAAAAAGATMPLTAPAAAALPPTRVAADGSASPARKRSALMPVGVGAGVIVAAVAGWLYFSRGKAPANAPAATDSASSRLATLPVSDTQRLSRPETVQHADAAAPAGSTHGDSSAANRAPATQTAGPPPAPIPTAPESRVAERGTRRPQGPSPSGGTSGPSGTAAPTSATSSAATSGAAAASARRAVQEAADNLAGSSPDPARALTLIAGALRHLPSRDDSVTALYHESEALFMNAELKNDDALRQRGCGVLKPLLGATAHPLHESISFLYKDRKCQ